MAKVRLQNLTKKFGNTLAVDDLTLEIESGEFVVLLGPSGCGKTTALRCIAGLEDPDSGDIFIDETRANEIPPKDRDVAMVFQNYALFPHMSVFDNIAFPLKMHKVPKKQIKARVSEVAEMLNISHFLPRKPRQLSGGEQQRVALARALVRQPRVFLMDEPLSNLDAKLRLYTRAEIKRLHSQIGVTTIYVTHDQAEAMSMADKIAVINKGKVVQYDTPAAIYDTPADVFVANFVGSPPMNLVKASVTHKDHGLALVADGFKYEVPESMVGRVGRASDREVLIGIRPESMILSEDQTPESLFEAEVYLCEPQGSNTVINLKVGNDILKSVVQGKFRATVGAKVWVSLPGEQVQVFDSQSGLRLA